MLILESHLRQLKAQDTELPLADFPQNLQWFNSPPLSFNKELQGKIVVLHFWTSCCVNCIHALPALAALEQKYASQPVVFISVHSPKFTNERTNENTHQAILRYEISHPAVNDPSLLMWKALEISSWPTFVIVGPKGNQLFSVSGEDARENLDEYISAVLHHYSPEDFNSQPLPANKEKNLEDESLLKFPSKLAIDSEGHRLFISDSNHNRILIVSEEGAFIDVIGSGKQGLEDGSYQLAQFHHPQGITYTNNTLYVADTKNHALRKVDLTTKSVTTIAGNGSQGHDYQGNLKTKEQLLSSPWDLSIDTQQQRLMIAMAGTHQIWSFDFTTEYLKAFSGSGIEQNLNSNTPLEAAWAQPSGLSINDNTLFVADSESSAIRSIDLKDGHTDTLIGGDPSRPYNLFNFGDVDGSDTQAKLQHPLAVLWLPKEQFVVVADTYNHKLKILDPVRKTIHSWIGNGTPGYQDGKREDAQFSEPSGLALSSDEKSIYVADTNNHVIRKVNISDGEVQTLLLKDIPTPLTAPTHQFQRLTTIPPHSLIHIPPVRIMPNSAGTFRIEITTPAGYHIQNDAPSSWQIVSQTEWPITAHSGKTCGSIKEAQIIDIPFTFDSTKEKNTVQIEALIYYCKQGKDTISYIDGVLFEIPMEAGNESSLIPLKYTLKSHP